MEFKVFHVTTEALTGRTGDVAPRDFRLHTFVRFFVTHTLIVIGQCCLRYHAGSRVSSRRRHHVSYDKSSRHLWGKFGDQPYPCSRHRNIHSISTHSVELSSGFRSLSSSLPCQRWLTDDEDTCGNKYRWTPDDELSLYTAYSISRKLWARAECQI